MQLHRGLEHHQPQCLQQARSLAQVAPLLRGLSKSTIQHEYKRTLGRVLAQQPILAAAAAAEADGGSITGPAAAAPGPAAKLRRRVVSILSISINLLRIAAGSGHCHGY